jgi:glycine cleavage system regulatory protein
VATLVLTVIGDDRSGLVSALSEVIADHGGSWERSQMARLAGKFAGIVLVTVPDQSTPALVDALGGLQTQGLLEITAEPGIEEAAAPETTRLSLQLLGADRPGIVQEISRVLAERDVSIVQLDTATREAPMAGGVLFEATATLLAPPDLAIGDLQTQLEELANELMVDLALSADATPLQSPDSPGPGPA